jgi:melanoma-associated antigen p97
MAVADEGGHLLLAQGDCSDKDPYFNYDGAVRCLFEDAGDVAFTKHTTVLEVVKGGIKTQPWSTLSAVNSAQARLHVLAGLPLLAVLLLPFGCRWASQPTTHRPGACCLPLQADIMLLCPAGGCAPVDQAETCNLGLVAAHAVVVRPEFKAAAAGKAAIAQIVSASASSTSGFLSAAKTLGGKSTTQLFQATTQSIEVRGERPSSRLLHGIHRVRPSH